MDTKDNKTGEEGTPEDGSAPNPSDTKESSLAPMSMKRISNGESFIKDKESKPKTPSETYPTCEGEIGIRVLGGDELMETFTAQYRKTDDAQEFDKLKTSEKIFLLTIAFGVENDAGEQLFTVSQLTKMYQGKNKREYSQFLHECWDGVISVNYWLDPKNPSSLRRMIRMLFG